MVGSDNVGSILIEGVITETLIDTGSQISTVREAFLENISPEPEIRDMDELELEVKCADGRPLLYKGYVTVNISRPFIAESQEEELPYPLLVVPATEYNRTVPLIAGTNIISRLKQRTSDTRDVPSTWDLAFSALTNNHIGQLLKLLSSPWKYEQW